MDVCGVENTSEDSKKKRSDATKTIVDLGMRCPFSRENENISKDGPRHCLNHVSSSVFCPRQSEINVFATTSQQYWRRSPRQTVGLEAGMTKPWPKQGRLNGLLRLVMDYFTPSKPSEPGMSILLSICQA